jgi:hypothetical protein
VRGGKVPEPPVAGERPDQTPCRHSQHDERDEQFDHREGLPCAEPNHAAQGAAGEPRPRHRSDAQRGDSSREADPPERIDTARIDTAVSEALPQLPARAGRNRPARVASAHDADLTTGKSDRRPSSRFHPA